MKWMITCHFQNEWELLRLRIVEYLTDKEFVRMNEIRNTIECLRIYSKFDADHDWNSINKFHLSMETAFKYSKKKIIMKRTKYSTSIKLTSIGKQRINKLLERKNIKDIFFHAWEYAVSCYCDCYFPTVLTCIITKYIASTK